MTVTLVPVRRLEANLGGVIRGKAEAIRLVLVALLAGGTRWSWPSSATMSSMTSK